MQVREHSVRKTSLNSTVINCSFLLISLKSNNLSLLFSYFILNTFRFQVRVQKQSHQTTWQRSCTEAACPTHRPAGRLPRQISVFRNATNTHSVLCTHSHTWTHVLCTCTKTHTHMAFLVIFKWYLVYNPALASIQLSSVLLAPYLWL